MFLLRHGQSLFNLHFTETRRDPGIEDPELTELGHRQAEAAAESLAHERITRVIISPYLRALQTAEPVLARHQASVAIMPEVRERAAFACDIGSAPALLAARFPRYEFGHLPEVWWPQERETVEETVSRADAFRAAMAGSVRAGRACRFRPGFPKTAPVGRPRNGHPPRRRSEWPPACRASPLPDW